MSRVVFLGPLLILFLSLTCVIQVVGVGHAFAQNALGESPQGHQLQEQAINETGLDQLIVGQEPDYHQQYFGCDLKPSLFCSPMSNKFKSYATVGNYSTVIPEISSPQNYVQGKYDRAIEMTARYRESIEVANSPSFSSEQFSVSFWIKPPKDVEPYAHLISHTDARWTRGWFIEHLPSSSESNQGSNPGAGESVLIFALTAEDGTITYSPEISLANDEFSHIAVTFNGSSIVVYRNGQMFSTTNYGKNYEPDPNLPLKIGSASYSTSTNRWSGIMDDLVLFNRALNKEEVALIAENDGPFENIKNGYSGITAYYPFDGNLKDASGNDNDATQSTLVVSMAVTPDGRILLSEKNTGRILVMKDDKILDQPFAQLSDVYVSWEQGLLGITVDPKFSENHFVYLYYAALDEKADEVYNKLVRFTDKNNKGEDMVVLLDRIQGVKGYHSGGALAFNPADDKLYITVGDATEHVFAQDPNTYLGKVLRINRDGTFPTDNPFKNSPVYTIGSRNMFGIAFDDKGYGIVTENGEAQYDEINHIEKGANFGFPTIQPANSPPELTDPLAAKWPLRSYKVTYAPTQAIYYTGDKFPELKGKYVFGTFTGDVFALSIDKENNRVLEEIRVEFHPALYTPIIGIAQTKEGDIYLASYGIFKLSSTGYDSRKEVVFPITISSPSSAQVRDVRIDPSTNSLTLYVSGGPDSYDVGIRVPKLMLDGIYQVTNEQGLQLSHDLSSRKGISGTEYNDIIVHYVGSSSQVSSIKISGASAMPEFGLPMIPFSSIFLAVSMFFIILNRYRRTWQASITH